MARIVYRYIFDDLLKPENNCIVSTIKQLSDECGIPYSTLQRIMKEKDIYYDKSGKFRLERRIHKIAESKIRKRNK